MSAYESIPPERQAAYLNSAKEAIEAATRPVVDPAVEALGELVVKEAESLTGADAQGSKMGGQAELFLASRKSVGGQAEDFLNYQEHQIEQQVDKVTGGNSFMALRREYPLPKDPEEVLRRIDSEKRMGKIGIQDQLWERMAEQNYPGPEKRQPPQV